MSAVVPKPRRAGRKAGPVTEVGPSWPADAVERRSVAALRKTLGMARAGKRKRKKSRQSWRVPLDTVHRPSARRSISVESRSAPGATVPPVVARALRVLVIALTLGCAYTPLQGFVIA